MARKKHNRITQGGRLPVPGQKQPKTVILMPPQRFGIDIGTYINSMRSADNVDYARNTRLFDLFMDILMDTHLSSVIDKRVNAVLCSQIEFRRGGKPDERVNQQLRSPWFLNFLRDAMDAQFWGFSLMQFYLEKNWINYDLIDRKHVDPIRRLILHQQTDIHGTSWDEFNNLLFIGNPRKHGLLAKAAPWVIYKRNTTADWVQFSEIFGMPIREYTYDGGDEEARNRIIEDAYNQGAAATFIHPKDSNLNLLESGNKSGSADLYERLCERCNSELSKLVLGNTLTTEASNTGTQALGTVHKKGEDRVAEADRRYILNILNYDMADIFAAMGINTSGGEFYFIDPKEVNLTTKMDLLVKARNVFQLPISDEYIYETLGIEKPKDYERLKQEIGAKSDPEPQPVIKPNPDKKDKTENESQENETGNRKEKSFKNLLSRFFGHAPQRNGALKW